MLLVKLALWYWHSIVFPASPVAVCCGCSLVPAQMLAFIQMPMMVVMTMLVVAMMRCRYAVMSACRSARALRRARRAYSGKLQLQAASSQGMDT